MFEQIKNEIATLLAKAAEINESTAYASLDIPKNNFGDISSKIAFDLTRTLQENPAEIAAKISKRIQGHRHTHTECRYIKHKYIERVVAVGPFINFFLSPLCFDEIVENVAKNPDYGKEKAENGKTECEKIIVEFPSVNPNKPWHIGHLRNALLGDSVARILSFNGKNVERIDYIDDLGLQVAQSLYGYLNSNLNSTEIQDKKLDHWIGEQYVRVVTEVEKNPEIDKKVRDLIKQLEQGSGNIAEQARQLSENVVKAQYETNFALGIYHDALIFESDIIRTIFCEGIEKLKTNGAIRLENKGKNKGCWVVRLGEKYKEMNDDQKVIMRSDGTATYTGKDVIFQLWKFGLLRSDFVYTKFVVQPNGKIAYKTFFEGKKMQFGKANRVVNIIGVEQNYVQEVIKQVFLALGYVKEAQNLIHLMYEHAVLPDGKFSGRKGTWIGYSADEFIVEAKTRALEKITKEMSESDKKETAEKIGIAAIKFSLLKTSPEKKIVFDWDNALSFEGDSGPYLQYACVRAAGILNNWGGKIDSLSLKNTAEGNKGNEEDERDNFKYNNEEKTVLRQILIFSEIVKKAATNLRPHYIADYALELATLFNKFYTKHQVINAEEKEKTKRLLIVAATLNTLKNALYLLGIAIPKKM
ncbi:MAG: arginine--tRNA ligase [Candidatus Micrarchaeota archaeon]